MCHVGLLNLQGHQRDMVQIRCQLVKNIHGHIKEKCDYSCKDGIYGKGIEYALKDLEMRESLFNDISRTTNFIKQRPKDCTKIVLPTIPKKIRALQIHNKFFIQNTEILSQIDVSNVCVECTILNDGGQNNPDYTQLLFCPTQVSKFVTNSASNLICSWLDK